MLLWCDGIDFYNSDADLGTSEGHLQRIGTGGTYTTGGRFGGGSLVTSGNMSAGNNRVQVFPNYKSTIIVQYAAKYAAALGGDFIMYIYDGAGWAAGLYLNSNGSLDLRNAAGTTIATSATGLIRAGVWHYFEWKLVVSNTGTFILRVDGQNIFTYAGTIDTQATNAYVYIVGLGGGSGGGTYDDIVMMDDTGTECNAMLGDCRITQLAPISDTADADWLKSTGTDGYAMIDDPVPGTHDGDSTYLYSNVVDDLSLFDLGNMVTSPTSIFAVQSAFVAKKTTTDARTIRSVLKSDDTVANGATKTLTTSYAYYHDVWTLNPDTSAAWAKSEVDAAQLGIETIS